jgi:xylulokinase
MLMYGTTMFLMNTLQQRATSSALWGTVGVTPGTYTLAGGMATSGAITTWLRNLVGSPDFSTLLSEADNSGPGANGLLMLPYFAGERTPIAEPTPVDSSRDLLWTIPAATCTGPRGNGMTWPLIRS